MNMNELAKEITLQEGKKKNLSIAQVKEVIALTMRKLAKMHPNEVDRTLERYRR